MKSVFCCISDFSAEIGGGGAAALAAGRAEQLSTEIFLFSLEKYYEQSAAAGQQPALHHRYECTLAARHWQTDRPAPAPARQDESSQDTIEIDRALELQNLCTQFCQFSFTILLGFP